MYSSNKGKEILNPAQIISQGDDFSWGVALLLGCFSPSETRACSSEEEMEFNFADVASGLSGVI